MPDSSTPPEDARGPVERSETPHGLWSEDDAATTEYRELPLPSRIGRYKIRRAIATGGMGTVYLAVQESPHRTVALKVMKSGIASRSALRRFEYESQILGRLRHPNIAQVYEAGTHDTGAEGVPYFAMEYVPNAKPITRTRRRGSSGTTRAPRADVREGLRRRAPRPPEGHHPPRPEAVEHPGRRFGGEPKIIDFGVARATDSDIAVTTMENGPRAAGGDTGVHVPGAVRGGPR